MSTKKQSSEFMKPKMTFGDVLRFSPYAWAKLLWMRDRGDTEVAGYGITETEDPLLITDFVLIKQECTEVSFDFDPDDGMEYVDKMMDQGLPPWAYSNILIHTHPGNSPNPSNTDETNFKKAFSHPHWAIMFIIAEGGNAYCRLKINVGPGIVKEIGVAIDWKQQFNGTDTQAWEKEYKDKVKEIAFRMTGKEGVTSKTKFGSNIAKKDVIDAQQCMFCDKEVEVYNRDSLCRECLEDLDHGGSPKGRDMYGDAFGQDEFVDCHWNSDGDVACWIEEKREWLYYNPLKQTWYKDNLDEDDVDDEMVEVAPPNEHLAGQIVSWADAYSDERSLAVEEA